MPLTMGMLLGQIKQLDKRLKILESKATKDEEQVRDTYPSGPREGEDQGQVRVGENSILDLRALHT
jgi:hypothetical protein